MKRLHLLLVLFFALALPFGAAEAKKAPKKESGDPYHTAFAMLDAGHVESAMAYAHGPDHVLNKVLRAAYMAQPGNDIGFDELAAFINDNPDWPGLKGITTIAEQKIPSTASSQEVASWFTAHPPVSLMGFYRAMDAYEATGQTEVMEHMIRARWVNGEFSNADLANFYNRYARYLNDEASYDRLDHLLWKNDSAGARRMTPYIDDSEKAVMDARLALMNQNPNAAAFVSRVPSSAMGDAGLQYELLRYRVHNNMDDAAIEILEHAPDNLGKPEAWWDQRQIIIRRVMLRHDYDLAYHLAAYHGEIEGRGMVDGEFMSGWLALRFLNEPAKAIPHFQAIYDNASTPMSRARGAYWLGRCYEAMNNKNEAEQAYENAAALEITYYGQLATTRLYADPVIKAMPEPKIPGPARQAFFNRDVIRAVERLYAIGERDRARTFFHAAVESATQRADFVLLTELAYQISRPDLAITAAKAASQKNIIIAAGGFPVLDHPVLSPPEPAFTHALIRQESMFNPNAESPVGAHGLMQLMPRTAQDVARKLGIKFVSARLGEEDYNLRLGTTFIQNQLAIFDGSYVLALAGYNAGPGRVRQWMAQIGDPRSPDVDPIDWIEMIPVSETRNYVQRILESLQIYRARLNGGQAPLLILQDLKR